MLGAAGKLAMLGAAAAVVGGCDVMGASTKESAEPSPRSDTVAFHGPHQAGIVTPVQERLVFGTFDLLEPDRATLRALLEDWTTAAVALTADAHIRLSAPSANKGIRILRRGYSFSDGVDTATGELDAGLFFVAYQRDPRHQFVPLQQRLASNDALNEYIEHVGSGIFAVLPGVAPGDVLGRDLFQ